MDIDGVVTVDLNSAYVDVDQKDGKWNVDCRHPLKELPIKRPYLINPAHIEYVEGDWNEARTEYGIRIGYVSGHTKCFWGETARKVLEELQPYDWDSKDMNEFLGKFDNRVKAGPPAV